MSIFLLPASLAVRTGSSVKNFLYDRGLLKPQEAPLPVISVGNISFGGTGKTPLVVDLLFWIFTQGGRPAFISRGYKGRWEKEGGVLSDGREVFGTWREGGDEPAMAAMIHPEAGVFVGKNRLVSCWRAREKGFDIAVLDDGFQYRKLQRHIDVVLFDPDDRTALREPISALSRSDILLVRNKAQIPDKVKKLLNPRHRIYEYKVTARGYREAERAGLLPLEILQGQKVMAFCGIAGPRRFFRQLEGAGAEVCRSISFADHFSYPADALKDLAKQFTECGAQAAVTTDKDAVKLIDERWFLDQVPLYVLRIGIDVEPPFYDVLREYLYAQQGKKISL